MQTWTFGPAGIYTATWDGISKVTVTLTAGGAFVASFFAQSLTAAIASPEYQAILAPAAVAVTNPPPYMSSDTGWLAWNFDPAPGITNSTVLTAGQVTLIGMQVRAPVSCTNVIVVVSTAGGTLTAGQNFAGLYNSAGTLVGTSADQTTPWGTTGLKTAALTGGPFTLPPGLYWVALVSNGTTTPAIGRGVNNVPALVNGTNTSATSRYGGILSGQTLLPGSITPSGIAQQGVGYWAALS